MRKSARTDLCGGRSVMIVPTASKYRSEVRLVNFGQQVVLLLGVAHASQALSQALTEVLALISSDSWQKACPSS